MLIYQKFEKGICQLCSVVQENGNYLFCNIEHRGLYIKFIERAYKDMNHPFDPSIENKLVCKMCRRDYIAHTPYAKCEKCKYHKECDVFDGMLLCYDCSNKHIEKLKEVITENEGIAAQVLASVQLREAEDIDRNINSSADIFNAHTIANYEIKKLVDADESIPQADKNRVYQEKLVARFDHFSSVIWNADNQKHDAVKGQLAIAKDLRALGNELREEFREKLKLSDATYAPLVKLPAAPKLKKQITDPFERMVQTYSAMNNISLDAARDILKKNMNPNK